MASLVTAENNGHTSTRVQGRVFRKFAKKTPGQKINSKESRRVCVLTTRGGRELEHWSIDQPCYGPGCHHTHQTREEVEKMVRSGMLRWVGKGNNVAAYTEGKEWRPKASDGFTVLQLV